MWASPPRSRSPPPPSAEIAISAEPNGHESHAVRFLAVDASAPHRVVPFSAASPLRLRRCGKVDFQLWQVAERPVNGWALLGEVGSKTVAVSPARFRSVHAAADGSIRVIVRGSANERLAVAFAPPLPTGHVGGSHEEEINVEQLDCTLPASGVAVMMMPARTCEMQLGL